MKIIADNKIPFLKGAFEPYADIEYLSPSEITKDRVSDADALIIRTRTRCNAELLSGSKVKFIATATIGYDHIDAVFCESENINWVSAPGCNSTSVMQYITSALLMFAGKKSIDLTRLTIGVVGVGNVGSKVAKAAAILGMKVLLNDPPRERKEGKGSYVSLDEIIDYSDIITFHTPLIKEGIDRTFHLADESFFSKLKRKIIIINSSRGPVADSVALKKAAGEGKLNGLILDVWEKEPELDLELLKLADIATPHIAGYSSDGKANGTSICVNAVNRFFNLGMEENWKPSEIPLPFNPVNIEIDCRNMTDQQILCRAVTGSYDIYEDNSALKKSPESFEKQRNYYKVRREFDTYKVTLLNPETKAADKLTGLGFNVLALK